MKLRGYPGNILFVRTAARNTLIIYVPVELNSVTVAFTPFIAVNNSVRVSNMYNIKTHILFINNSMCLTKR